MHNDVSVINHGIILACERLIYPWKLRGADSLISIPKCRLYTITASENIFFTVWYQSKRQQRLIVTIQTVSHKVKALDSVRLTPPSLPTLPKIWQVQHISAEHLKFVQNRDTSKMESPLDWNTLRVNTNPFVLGDNLHALNSMQHIFVIKFSSSTTGSETNAEIKATGQVQCSPSTWCFFASTLHAA